MSEFTGFGPDTIAFLAGLSANNNKQWFDAHRSEYETQYLAPAKAFVHTIGDRLQALAPGIHAEPRVNGSIFRINRDIRFSSDKTPYKDHLDLWFWEGERKGAVSGLFFRLTAERLILGAGAHGFTPQQLTAYREALADKRKGAALLEIEDRLAAAGLPLRGEHYARIPRGLSFSDPRLERLSKFNALHAAYDNGHPGTLGTPQFVDHCLGKWRDVAALHSWLVAM